MKTALTIAGSDSGGGAGIQADLKTFSALGVYGMSVITAVTAQNTREVRSVQNIDVEVIKDQFEAVVDDLPVNGIKIGMLSTEEIIKTVSNCLKKVQNIPIVLDPVMISKSGHPLLKENAVSALIQYLLPQSFIITPNLPEAEVLANMKIADQDAMVEAAKMIHKQGPRYVLVKGGHLEGEAADLFYDGEKCIWIKGERIHTKNTHGTGCTLSSAICAFLARGEQPAAAVEKAKAYITTAIRHSLNLGGGHGPTHHFYDLYQKAGLLSISEEEK